MDDSSAKSTKSVRTNIPESTANTSSIYARTDSAQSRRASGEDDTDRQRVFLDRDVVDYTHNPISRTNTIDRSTSWVLGHHAPNLILKLQRPVDTSIFGSVSKKSKVVDTEERKEAEEDDVRYRISFSELQNMHVRKLQCKLVKRVLDLRISEQDAEGDGEWEDLLRQYIQAVRDFDYMTECSKRERDPFHATGEYYTDKLALQKILQDTGLQSDFHRLELQTYQSRLRWETPDPNAPRATILGTRKVNVNVLATRAFYWRLGIAVLSAAFLLGPMWMMAYSPKRATALWGTTAFVLIFGLVMARWLERDAEVMSSTAAYAAVLVVFVGLILEDTAKS